MADNSELAALRAGLGDTSWLLGGRRRRRAAEQLAARGTPESARALAEVFIAGADKGVVAIAHRALTGLTDPAAIDAICDMLIATGDQRLGALITTAGHTHSDPTRRALLLFLAGEFDRYAELDFDGTLLAAAHATAEEALRTRLADRARQSGRVEWVRAIAGRHARLEELSDAEWENAIAVLVAAGQWDQLWRLALEAPPVWGVLMLEELSQRDWQPTAETERAIHHQLSTLAARATKLPSSSLWTPPYDESVLEGHRFTRGLVVSPDGGRLASASEDGTVRLWRLPSGASVGTLTGHHSEYLLEGCCLAVSPDGGLLASGGNDRTVRLWRLPSGAPAGTLTGHTGGVSALAVSPDGGLLASAGGASAGSAEVRLWRLPSGQPAGTLTGHTNHVPHLAVSPDGELLASASWDGTVRLWRLPSGEPAGTLTGHKGSVSALAVSPDGTLLASASYGGTLRLWRLPSGQPAGTLTGHTGSVNDLVMSPDGRLLASAGSHVRFYARPEVRLWRLPSGEAAGILTGHGDSVKVLAVSPDGGLLASAGEDHRVHLWRLPSGASVGTLTGHESTVYRLAVSPNGRLLVSAGSDHTVRLWESKLLALSRTPIGKISLAEIKRLRPATGKHPDDARVWADLIMALVRCRHRFDIEVNG